MREVQKEADYIQGLRDALAKKEMEIQLTSQLNIDEAHMIMQLYVD